MISIMNESDFFTEVERACGPGVARDHALEQGANLFLQGAAPLGLLRVMDGQIDLIRWTASGQDVRIHTSHAGETFAEASLYASACHCDAVAAVRSRVRQIPKRKVLAAFAADPSLGGRFAQHLAGSLMSARRLLELRAITPLTERLLTRLRDLADADGTVPDTRPLTALATDLGVTAPALYRAIADLETNGKLTRPARGRVALVTGTARPRPAP